MALCNPRNIFNYEAALKTPATFMKISREVKTQVHFPMVVWYCLFQFTINLLFYRIISIINNDHSFNKNTILLPEFLLLKYMQKVPSLEINGVKFVCIELFTEYEETSK